jgi:hypothetical protein
LYLLHWPLLVTAQHLAIVDLSWVQKIALLFFTVVLSAASWRWIETPFRSRQRLTRQQVFVGGGLVMSLTGGMGLLIANGGGLPQRFDSPAPVHWTTCDPGVASNSHNRCGIGSRVWPRSFLLWGDSHARTFRTALNESAYRWSRAGLLAYKPNSPPLTMQGPPNRMLYGPNSRPCREFNDQVLEYVRAHPELTTIVLVARWARYGEKGRGADVFPSALGRTVLRLADMERQVVVVNQVPEVGHHVPEAYRAASLTSRNLNRLVAPTREQYASRNRHVLAVFDTLQRGGIRVIDVRDRLCGPRRCRIVDGGQPLYFDDNHLSDHGSRYVSTLFDPILAQHVNGARIGSR